MDEQTYSEQTYEYEAEVSAGQHSYSVVKCDPASSSSGPPVIAIRGNQVFRINAAGNVQTVDAPPPQPPPQQQTVKWQIVGSATNRSTVSPASAQPRIILASSSAGNAQAASSGEYKAFVSPQKGPVQVNFILKKVG